MMNKIDTLIVDKLFKILNERETSGLNKDILIDLIILYNDFGNETFNDTLKKLILSKDMTIVERDVYLSKLNTIISKLTSPRYLEKILTKDYILYIYQNFSEIYLNKDFNVNVLIDKILNLNTKEIVFIDKKNKKSYENVNIEMLKSEELTKQFNRKNILKIRLYNSDQIKLAEFEIDKKKKK
jgi:hypothetical protein